MSRCSSMTPWAAPGSSSARTTRAGPGSLDSIHERLIALTGRIERRSRAGVLAMKLPERTFVETRTTTGPVMALSADELTEIERVLVRGRRPARARWPSCDAAFRISSWTRCDASDVTEAPFRSYARFDLHLLDGADHCVQITADPDAGHRDRAGGAECNAMTDPALAHARYRAAWTMAEDADIVHPAVRSRYHAGRTRGGRGRAACRPGFPAGLWSKRSRRPLPPISAANMPSRFRAARSGFLIALAAYGIGPGAGGDRLALFVPRDGSCHQPGRRQPVFADIDYWAGTLVPEKVEARITAKTRAIVACNNNGHPAPWPALRAIAQEASVWCFWRIPPRRSARKYQGALVGTFGDVAVFDFSQPVAL